MDIKILLGVFAVVCEIACAVLYFRDIYQGNTKPHLYTLIVWCIVMSISFAGMIVGGGGPGTWGTGFALAQMLVLAIISVRYGTTDVTASDRWFLIAALFSILPWILTRDPLLSVILASIIDACGMVPTLRKTWNAPRTESLSAWNFALGRSVFQLAALRTYSPLTLMYILEVLVADAILVGIIVYRRKYS